MSSIALFTRFAFVTVAVASLANVACTQSVDTTRETEQTESEIRRKPTSSQKTPQSCPPVATPMCSAGTELVAEKDSTGCTFYTCKVVCPEIDIPSCAAGEELVTGNDENGCSFAYCKPAACPPIDVPQCQPGQSLKYTTDANGCSFADCE